MNRVLRDREQRANEIARLLHQHEAILSIHANIPGEEKNMFPSTWLVQTFAKMAPWAHWQQTFYESEDGAYVLAISQEKAEELKHVCVHLEDTHPLGRLIDLDVHTHGQQLHRLHPRPCLVCGGDTFVCRRTQKHRPEEVMQTIQNVVLQELSRLLDDIVSLAMDAELNLDPKFGLVTPYSTGSHHDMDYALMKHAKNAILPFFSEAFRCGASQPSIESGVHMLRLMGFEAEQKMFEATHHVNAYRGLIFDLGFYMYALGFAFAHSWKKDTIPGILTKMMKEPELQLRPIPSFGGARKEMADGLPTLFSCPSVDIHDNLTLYRALRHFIVHLEDSTLIRRANDVSVVEVQKRFRLLDISNREEIQSLSDWCISHRLTFGGSADMLVLAIIRDQIIPILFP